jgi:hypothetical protein
VAGEHAMAGRNTRASRREKSRATFQPVWSRNSPDHFHAYYDLLREEFLNSGMLLSAGATIAGLYNLRPEQNLAHHTQNTENEDQLHSARTQPEPNCVPGSLHSFQQVIQEKQYKQHRTPIGNRKSLGRAGW